MISAVVGHWGVGKTHYLSSELHKKAEDGWFCISNFSHLETNINGAQMDTKEFIELLKEVVIFKDKGYEMVSLFPSFKHTGVFIAIDEGHLYFNREIDNRADFPLLLKLFSQLRKQDIEIMYTAQEPDKISIDWRRYTKRWIRLRRVLPFLRSKKPFQHEKQDCIRYEVRYWIPFIREEIHELDYRNPKFNYSTIVTDGGTSEWSKHSTVMSRRFRYVDSFIYNLYDSNEVLAINSEELTAEFERLRNFAVIPWTMEKEIFPTFKNILKKIGFKVLRNDEKVPPRYIFDKNTIKLPTIERTQFRGKTIEQPSNFVQSLKDLRSSPLKKYLSEFRKSI